MTLLDASLGHQGCFLGSLGPTAIRVSNRLNRQVNQNPHRTIPMSRAKPIPASRQCPQRYPPARALAQSCRMHPSVLCRVYCAEHYDVALDCLPLRVCFLLSLPKFSNPVVLKSTFTLVNALAFSVEISVLAEAE